jgi:protein-disulfide isomerase
LNGKKHKVGLLAAMLILVLCGGVPRVMTRAEPAAQGAALSDALSDKIVTYIRERFGVPDTVKLSLGKLHTSSMAPGFNEGTVTVDDGKKQGAQPVLVSKDSRYLIVVPGSIIELHQNSTAEMTQRLQEAFKAPANVKLSVGGFKHSPYPDFEEGTLTLDDGRAKNEKKLLLTRDGKHLIVSDLYSLAVDPRQKALRTISLRDVPTQGPANAPVTIVEYADLECPTCARVHEFLETQVVPRYGNKVRVVFKEYPLPMHDWSLTAAIACQCAYGLNPPSYVPLRTAIFRNQQLINITNLRETLLSYGEQAGVDRVKLAGCLDAKSTYPHVQRDIAEGKRIDVNQTPTVFINGRMLIGLPSEDAYFQAIDEALNSRRQ